eukprot:445435-Prymnesium_polylepis.1
MQNHIPHSMATMPLGQQQGMGQPQQHHQMGGQPPAPFCGVPGSELAAMAQAAWGQAPAMEPSMQHAMHHPGMPPDPTRHAPGGMPEQQQQQQPVSLSAQAELELELSLRGSLLVQQQRRIVQLEDELQRAWTEIDRLRTKISSVERDRQRPDDDTSKQVRPPSSALAETTRPLVVWTAHIRQALVPGRPPVASCAPRGRPRPLDDRLRLACTQPRYWTPEEHRRFM